MDSSKRWTCLFTEARPLSRLVLLGKLHGILSVVQRRSSEGTYETDVRAQQMARSHLYARKKNLRSTVPHRNFTVHQQDFHSPDHPRRVLGVPDARFLTHGNVARMFVG